MTTWKATLRWLSVFAIATLLVACRSDGEEGGFANALSRIRGEHSDNQPPVISGAPQSKIVAGQRYEFLPSASDPDGGKLEFTITNKPRWSNFDAKSGRLAGTPRASDVGEFRDISIAVSDGKATRKLVFDVRVADEDPDSGGSGGGSGSGGSGSGGGDTGGGVDPQPTPTGPTLPIGESQFRFAEVPEIVFVRGYADREMLGIFHIDTGNRWAPGDLDNDAGWQPRIDTNLEVVDGSLAGVSYDASTAVLRYDGGGSGNQTATVRLTAPGRSVSSARFRIRVLQPTVVWGVGAATRFPDIGLESSRVTWTDMQRSLRVDATDAAPNVLLVTGGRYESDFYIGRGKRNLYILGEPGARPTLVSGGLNLDDVEIGYLKNFELVDAVIDGSKFPTDRPVNVYVTQVYQHDSTRELNGIGTPDYEGDSEYGIVKAPNTQTHWIWNFHGSQMGSPSNLRHQVYVHGRPAGYLNVNNIRVDGARG